MIILILIVGIVSAFCGAKLASSKGRDPALWGLMCFLFPLLGLIVLACVGDLAPSRASATSTPFNSPSISYPTQPDQVVPAAPAVAKEKYDRKKWETLKEVDDDIAAAAKLVGEHGHAFEDELAEKFLAISDKAYLPKLVERIVSKKDETLRALKEDEAMRKEAIDHKLLEDYELSVRENYGRDPQHHKSVKSVVHYSGNAKEYIGGLMITLEDGIVILKTRTSQRNFRSVAEVEKVGWL